MKKNRKHDLLYDYEKDGSNVHFYWESERRDIFYSALVKDIVKNNRTSQLLKICFFIIVCFVFIGVCAVGGYVLVTTVNKDSISLSDAGTAFAGFGSIIGAIIVLPQIIANHLFPGNSEKTRFDFIKSNQKFDQSQLNGSEDDDYEVDETEDDKEDS